MDTISRKHIQGLIDQLNLSSFEVVLSEESHDPNAWKSLPAKTLSKMRKYKHVVGNAILISKPGAKFWIDFIKRSFRFKHRNVLESFSTWHLTEFIEKMH